jgi:hypothetical protein
MFGNDTNQIGLSILRIRIDPGGQSKWGTELGKCATGPFAGGERFRESLDASSFDEEQQQYCPGDR